VNHIVEAAGTTRALESAILPTARHGASLAFEATRPNRSSAIKPQEVYVKELSILGIAINPNTHLSVVELLPAVGLERLGIASYPLEAHVEVFTAHRARAAGRVRFAPQGS
jgi:hypothetical protein